MKGLAFLIAAAALPVAMPVWPASPEPPAVNLAQLEKLAWEHNPTMAAAVAALRDIDEQIRKAGSDTALVEQLTATRTELYTEQQRMSMRFRTLFFHVLIDQQRVESRERLAKVAREAMQVTDQLFNVGAADVPDRLAIANESAQMESTLAAARYELESLREVLKSAVGDPTLELGSLEGDLVAEMPVIDREEWHQRLLSEIPSLKAAQDEIAEAEKALADARRKPDVAATAKAEAALLQARLRAEHLRVTLEIAFAEAYSDYRAFVDDLGMYRGGALERAEQAYAEALRHYQEMRASYPQVLVARRTLYQMQDAALDSLQNSWAAALDLQGKLPFKLPKNPAPPVAAPATPAPPAKPGGGG
jgi:outer membrane protein, heavy metal efflux system